jgi:hypothetical protein
MKRPLMLPQPILRHRPQTKIPLPHHPVTNKDVPCRFGAKQTLNYSDRVNGVPNAIQIERNIQYMFILYTICDTLKTTHYNS